MPNAKRAMGSHHHPNEGATNVWLTPKHIIDALGPFDLDPCACDDCPTRCALNAFTEAQDGLAQPWSGLVYCNPPYGPHLGPWLQRCAEHNDSIALIMARTETAAVNPVLASADLVLFLKGRLTFLRSDGTLGKTNAGAPSMILAWGNRAVMRLRMSGLPGAYFVPMEQSA